MYSFICDSARVVLFSGAKYLESVEGDHEVQGRRTDEASYDLSDRWTGQKVLFHIINRGIDGGYASCRTRR